MSVLMQYMLHIDTLTIYVCVLSCLCAHMILSVNVTNKHDVMKNACVQLCYCEKLDLNCIICCEGLCIHNIYCRIIMSTAYIRE